MAKKQENYIASMKKKIATVAGKYVLIIPKPLVDSNVLSLEKEYEFVIKDG